MGDRKFARGQKRVEAATIMHEEGENHRIDSIRCVPPAIAKDRFAETGLLITEPDAAIEKCQRQETAALIRLLEENGAKQWYKMRLMDLPVPPERFGAEMAKGDSRYVYGEDVRAKPALRRQTELDYARRAQNAVERWKVQASDDAEKVALIQEAEALLRQAAEKGRPKQLDLFSQP
jgi:hypothetical protein